MNSRVFEEFKNIHCILFNYLEPHNFKRPQVEMMARRWQHHCIEIREAAQQILLGELGRMGKKGRKQLVESWAQFLPLYTHTEPIVQQLPQSASQQSISGAPTTQVHEPNVNNTLHLTSFTQINSTIFFIRIAG